MSYKPARKLKLPSIVRAPGELPGCMLAPALVRFEIMERPALISSREPVSTVAVSTLIERKASIRTVLPNRPPSPICRPSSARLPRLKSNRPVPTLVICEASGDPPSRTSTPLLVIAAPPEIRPSPVSGSPGSASCPLQWPRYFLHRTDDLGLT